MATVKQLQDIAKRLRIHSLRMTSAAGSGHPTTCMSMAEIASVLFFHEMRYNVKDPKDFANDELVLSKGHAAPILWAAYAEAGILPADSLSGLRKVDSVLEGHPTPRMPWVKAATGSLGQGLGVAVGMALAMRMGNSPARAYCVMGDGECAEGSVWEAAGCASHEKLENLVAIVDVNRLGQNGPTMHEHDLDAYVRKFAAFGWDAVAIDGHDVNAIMESLDQAKRARKPFAIIAKTFKGKGVSFLESADGWHGKAPNKEELQRALAELGPIPGIDAKSLVQSRPVMGPLSFPFTGKFSCSSYDKPAATRDGFGKALVSLGRLNQGIVAVDAEVRNSTREEWFFKEFPQRSVNAYIAEQAMVGIAMGLAAKGYTPIPSTFSAFFARAHDQIRMAALSGLNIKFVGSHSGVSIGEDGPSQMGLEDLALFRSMPHAVVLSPSDAVSAECCADLVLRHNGLGYLRTARMDTPAIYAPKEKFVIGGSKVLRTSPKDAVAIVATGVSVHEALKAYDSLKADGVCVRVIDAYSIQPLDVKTLMGSAKATKGNVIVVEDHYEAGGLGEAVSMALSGAATIKHLCVREYPRSGKPIELFDEYGIGAKAIAKAVRSLV